LSPVIVYRGYALFKRPILYVADYFFRECCSRCRFQPYDRRHPLRGVDSVHVQILLMGACRQCGSWSVAGHNHRKVIGQDPMVHRRPRMTREIETWLSDSRVGNNSVVDHRSRRPVLSPPCNFVYRCHV